MKTLVLFTGLFVGSFAVKIQTGTRAASRDPGCNCQCSNTTFKDKYGRINGNCKSTDKGGQWCYVDPRYSQCNDLHKSQRFNQHWSYQACATPELGSHQCRGGGGFGSGGGHGGYGSGGFNSGGHGSGSGHGGFGSGGFSSGGHGSGSGGGYGSGGFNSGSHGSNSGGFGSGGFNSGGHGSNSGGFGSGGFNSGGHGGFSSGSGSSGGYGSSGGHGSSGTSYGSGLTLAQILGARGQNKKTG